MAASAKASIRTISRRQRLCSSSCNKSWLFLFGKALYSNYCARRTMASNSAEVLSVHCDWERCQAVAMLRIGSGSLGGSPRPESTFRGVIWDEHGGKEHRA